LTPLKIRGLGSFVLKQASSTRERRRGRYGHDAPLSVVRLIESPPAVLSARQVFLLAAYVIIGSPKDNLILFYRYFTDRDTPMKTARIEALAREAGEYLSGGCRVLTSYFERRLYSRDLARVPSTIETLMHRTTPLLVVQPRTETDVQETLRFADTHGLPVFPRGIASSAFGGATPTMNGIALDFSAMTGEIEVDKDRRTVRVLPGTRWADLARTLEPFDLEPVTTPTSRFSTIGGWASTGGLGLNGYGYGHFAEAILRARVALPNGTILVLEGPDARLGDYVGTEGQFGIFTEFVLKVRPKPKESFPCLYCFESLDAAVDFIARFASRGHRPCHVAVYNEARMREENVLFRDLTGRTDSIVPEENAVLLHFERAEDGQRFAGDMGTGNGGDDLRLRAARWLWSERYFPLKAHRVGPGMLASEVVLPLRLVPTFVEKAPRLARRFGSELALEILVSRTAVGEKAVVIASFLCDKRRRLDYLFRLLLVQLLTHEAVGLGGIPYGFGIWNSPFIGRRYSASERRRLETLKRENDPLYLLNPRKYLRVRTRLFNIPALLFAPRIFMTALAAARLASPVIGALARLTPGPKRDTWQVPDSGQDGGRTLLLETAARCTFCGACLSTCPAYLVTRDELVTGRAKLRMAETLAGGGSVLPREAASPFQCLRCGLCEEVCQTRLPLRDCYLALEAELEQINRRPDDLIREFLSRVDRDRSFLEKVLGAELPAWTPEVGAAEEGRR
jgi:FAD/FMN-containing dehydrogenase/ferredoxin